MKKRLIFLVIACIALTLSGCTGKTGEQPRRAEAFSVYSAGGLKIVRVVDMKGMLPTDLLLGDVAEIERLLPDKLCPNVITSYVFDTGNEVVMLDTGFGDMQGGKVVENLREAGYAPEDISTIILTHLHGDHVGGTIRDHQAVFKNAQVFVPEKELAFWTDKTNNLSRAPAVLANTFDLVDEFMRLYSGRVVTFKEGERVVEWLIPIAVPGHTDGHTMFELAYGGEKRFVWGDIMHCLKAQSANPDISVIFDTDPVMAAQTRKKVMNMVADTGVPVFGGHFPSPGVMTFEKNFDGGYNYTPVYP